MNSNASVSLSISLVRSLSACVSSLSSLSLTISSQSLVPSSLPFALSYLAPSFSLYLSTTTAFDGILFRGGCVSSFCLDGDPQVLTTVPTNTVDQHVAKLASGLPNLDIFCMCAVDCQRPLAMQLLVVCRIRVHRFGVHLGSQLAIPTSGIDSGIDYCWFMCNQPPQYQGGRFANHLRCFV